MLTKGDLLFIRSFKERGYSISRTARILKLNRKAVAQCWGPVKNSENLEDYFLWTRCFYCGLEFPHPKFLPEFQCPKCKTLSCWRRSWYE
jgi:hypothetical protein